MDYKRKDESDVVWFAKQLWMFGWGLVLVIALTVLAEFIPQHTSAGPSYTPPPAARTPAEQANK
ncbi:MAG TPA: hypothetical protein VMQ60_00970 [Acidobacteriaceae bacterium]|jgi:hypothetical protein|nr:hypothetical protein [Acidobacteriaceae bacterium]